MALNRGLDFLDFIVFLFKKKMIIFLVFFTTLILSYLAIYFFIDEKYDSDALIYPSEQNQLSGISSLMKSFSSLPIGLGGSQNNSVDMYTTIVYSRSNLMDIISHFGLYKGKIKLMEDKLKAIRENIFAEETKEGAFSITVRSESAQKSAQIVNYIVKRLNERVIELNISKAKSNREFLQLRYQEILNNLRNSEDSLRNYQKASGLLEAQSQSKVIIEAFADLEAQLAKKKIEYEIMSKIMGKDAPATENSLVAYNEFEKMVKLKKSGQVTDSPLLPLSSLPEKAMQYFRYYRDVEIFQKMLEFIVPLYEQARFEEQKEVPVLQVIDYGVPAEKKSYPMRVLSTIIITLIVSLIYILILLIKEIVLKSENEKIIFLRQNFFKKNITK